MTFEDGHARARPPDARFDVTFPVDDPPTILLATSLAFLPSALPSLLQSLIVFHNPISAVASY